MFILIIISLTDLLESMTHLCPKTVRNKKNKKNRYISCLALNLNKNTTYNKLVISIIKNRTQF